MDTVSRSIYDGFILIYKKQLCPFFITSVTLIFGVGTWGHWGMGSDLPEKKVFVSTVSVIHVLCIMVMSLTFENCCLTHHNDSDRECTSGL